MIRPEPYLPKALNGQAEEKWSEFIAAAGDFGSIPEMAGEFVSEAKMVFCFSDFVASACTRNPDLFFDLISSGDLHRPYDAGDYDYKLESMLKAAGCGSEGADMDTLKKVLRRFRRREMVRIAWRDLSAPADLDETMNDVSTLADVCISKALDRIYQRLVLINGVPRGPDGSAQYLVVVGMGKLGARELNFSSDVDLIFAYSKSGYTDGRDNPISNESFFMKTARGLVNAIGDLTADGFVFRVDMGLRPDGKNGPLVMNFDNIERYYQIHGREWERYAWIKARIVAGNPEDGKRLLDILKPFVYRRYMDYGVFESLRDMKRMIVREVARKNIMDNIKLGHGGIREIEFFGQVFQLIRGGLIPELQDPRIQNILKALVWVNSISKKACETLTGAYRFLRYTENRLQAFSDMQTHDLPADPDSRERLAASLGFASWEAFREAFDLHTSRVRRLFSSLLEPEHETPEDEDESVRIASVWEDPPEKEVCLEILSSAGFREPSKILAALVELGDDSSSRAMNSDAQRRLNKLVPLVLEITKTCEHPDQACIRILDLLETLKKRPNYFSLILENPPALRHLANLADSSSRILTFLSTHPLLLDELLDSRTLYHPPEKNELKQELEKRMKWIAADDLESQMETLRVFKQVNYLKVAAADATNTIPLMRVSDYLTYIAETVLDEVIEIAWRHMAEKHGPPCCELAGEKPNRGFAVIAYGKMGGVELGYDSDLDLVFIHAGTAGNTGGNGYSISNTRFFARLGQRVLHILSTQTAVGKLYEADMRLRPGGTSGMLVSHIDSFDEYQMQKAWTWETQALVRARPIYGDAPLIDRFLKIREKAVSIERDGVALALEIKEMRERMKKERKGAGGNLFDLKRDSGGVIDIEFIVQYLVLRHARRNLSILKWSDNVRLIGELGNVGVIDDKTAYLLRKAYLTYRSAIHRKSLREEPPVISADRFTDLREAVQSIWKRYIEPG